MLNHLLVNTAVKMSRFVESSTQQQFYGSTAINSPSYGHETDDREIFSNENLARIFPKREEKPITGDVEEVSKLTRIERSEYANFVDKIESLAISTESAPLLIKDALVTGHSYKLIKITQVETRWGPKMVWLLQDVDEEDTVPQEIYESKTLARYVTKNNQLDPVMVNCLKTCRINYYGFLGDELYGVSKYLFTVTV